MATEIKQFEWKPKFTAKEAKAHKSEIMELAQVLPKIFKRHVTKYEIPGFAFISHGIQYYKNEPIDPCKSYYVSKSEYEEYQKGELHNILRKDFMDRGKDGLMDRINEVWALHHAQQQLFPHLFSNT